MMTPDELYAKGYTLEYSLWGVSVYRTIDGSPGSSDAAVECAAQRAFGRPVGEDETIKQGWELATADFVKRRLTT